MTDNLHTKYQVYENENLTIQIEKDNSLLCLSWKGRPESAQYRLGYRQAIQIALEQKVQFWLTDSRQVSYLIMADQRWMYSKMRPLLKGGKLTRMAIVIQPETLVMTEQYPFLDEFDSGTKTNKSLCFQFFLDMDAAYVWLLNGE